jgi:branched-chain amino acid transport system substrate-binding protein
MKLGGEAIEGNYCSLPGMPLEKLAKGPEFKEKIHQEILVRISSSTHRMFTMR